jgi:hypothetical protein
MTETPHSNEPHLEIGIEEMKKFLEKYEIRQIRIDFLQKMTLLIIASLGFITAIAWDQVLKLIFLELFDHLSSIQEKLLYALIITVIATALSIILTKIFLKKKVESSVEEE